ncbi:MAG: hypothetical protein JNL10_09075 [Verrucomicrobiales bacterium]|nr:hypothetical protein [Verrucomicrobiales bacterium]
MLPRIAIALLVCFSRLAAFEPPGSITNLAYIDLNGDGANDVRLYLMGAKSINDVFSVVSEVRGIAENVVLSRSTDSAFFSVGDAISTERTVYIDQASGLSWLPISGYIAYMDYESLVWYIFPARGNSPFGAEGKTDVIVGIRLRVEANVHYGWVRFSRPDAKLETLFSVAGSDWNPVPDVPIRAGFPPEIPIASEILPDSAGVRLSWPPGTSNWILESTRRLSPPVVWEPYPAGGTYADVPPEEADRFFRLRRPE